MGKYDYVYIYLVLWLCPFFFIQALRTSRLVG